VVSGAHPRTAGSLLLFGKEAGWSSPHDALANGVATIYQDLALAPRLSIWQNIFIGSELRKRVLPGLNVLDKKSMRELAVEYLRRLNQDIDAVDRPVIGSASWRDRATR